MRATGTAVEFLVFLRWLPVGFGLPLGADALAEARATRGKPAHGGIAFPFFPRNRAVLDSTKIKVQSQAVVFLGNKFSHPSKLKSGSDGDDDPTVSTAAVGGAESALICRVHSCAGDRTFGELVLPQAG